MRKFVSLMLFYSLLVMLVTGVVLFIMPHGRVAYWTGWTLLGLDKDQWDDLHVIFGFLMLFFGFWHLTLNWRAFVSYFKGKSFVAATLFTLVCAFGAVMHLPPFKNFIDWGESIKRSWPKPKTMPPVPHAELLPLSKVAALLKLSPQEAVELLKKQGLKVSSPSETLKQIAKENSTTPARVYELLLESSKGTSPKPAFAPGSGLGMKTLGEVCRQLGLSPNVCVNRLKERGIEAKPNQTLREIAFSHGLYPYQILQIISGGQNGKVGKVGR